MPGDYGECRYCGQTDCASESECGDSLAEGYECERCGTVPTRRELRLGTCAHCRKPKTEGEETK